MADPGIDKSEIFREAMKTDGDSNMVDCEVRWAPCAPGGRLLAQALFSFAGRSATTRVNS